jgi:hypothetical protein
MRSSWDNVKKYGRERQATDGNITRRMRFACWLTKATDTLRIGLCNTMCPTRYRPRHFFNNFTTNEDIATKLEADYRHIPLYFSHNERTRVQISLHYLH